MKYYQILENPVLLKKIAFWCIVGGAVIVLLFLVIIFCKGIGLYGGVLDMAITGQVGDFVGGLVGSIWTLASIILFVAALKMQGDEIKIQQQEIKNQTEEFRSSRINNLIFKQAEVSNSYLSKITFFYQNNSYNGYNALINLKGAIDRMNYHIDEIQTDERIIIIQNIQALIQSAEFKIYIEHIHQSNKLLLDLVKNDNINQEDKHFYFKLYSSLAFLKDLFLITNNIMPLFDYKYISSYPTLNGKSWGDQYPERYKQQTDFFKNFLDYIVGIVNFYPFYPQSDE